MPTHHPWAASVLPESRRGTILRSIFIAILATLPALLGGQTTAAVLWLEAERFDDIGTWVRDSQFLDQMGSPYLLAAGIGQPVEDAVTTVDIPTDDAYRLWVRCKNWVPEHDPGRFQVLVDEKTSPTTFGTLKSDKWLWQDGGTFKLRKGKSEIRLRDLTGYYGRCDAIVLSNDSNYRPSDDMKTLTADRIRHGGISSDMTQMDRRDVVVVGGGLAGICAALSAARHGATVALVQNRPVLGGNDSPEIGVGAQGCSPEGFDPGETGIPKEIGSEQDRMRRSQIVTEEPNVSLHLNMHATGVRMVDKDTIAAVEAVNTTTGQRMVFPGSVFIDCTGDGTVGAAAGADFRMGREGRSEFDETLAPDKPDACTLGATLTYRGMPEGRMWIGPSAPPPRPYEAPAWARQLPDGTVDTDFAARGEQWWLEWGGARNTINDAEAIRDELLRIVYGLWAVTPGRGTRPLEWVQWVAGSRESRRLMGDYIMTQHDVSSPDIASDPLFPDRVAFGGWPVDLHPPLGFYTYKQVPVPEDIRASLPHSGDEPAFQHGVHKSRYSIPFRSLYSRNISNLMMAGRDISVSHVALGSTRVMLTCATMGQAVGTAAAICVQQQTTPRGVYEKRLEQLQQQLLKDGAYIIRLQNADPNDLALKATVTASSANGDNYRAEYVNNGFAREEMGCTNAWSPDPKATLPQSVELNFGQPVTFNTVHVTFQHSKLAAKAYRIEAFVDDKWQVVSTAPSHDVRFRRTVLGFPSVTANRVRIVIDEAAAEGVPVLCEIRVYNEEQPQQGVHEAG